MSGYFAKDTSVSVEKSRGELEGLLRKYGGNAFAYGNDDNRVMIGFRIFTMDKFPLAVRMEMPIPSPADKRFTHTRVNGDRRHPEAATKAWEQECRALWRALVLVVKAKLEACAIGISTVEREFYADIVLPNGLTMMQYQGADVRRMLETGDSSVSLSLPAGKTA